MLLQREDKETKLEKFLRKEGTHLQLRKLFPIWILILSLLMMKLFQGSKGEDGADSLVGLDCGSGGYWGVFVGFFVIALGVIFWNSLAALREHKAKTVLGYTFAEGDIKWTPKIIGISGSVAFIGGILAALAGVGGGIIFSPLMISMNVHPSVAISTALYMEMNMVVTTAAQYMIQGKMNYLYALWLMPWVVIGTLIGMSVISKLIRKLGRVSLLLFLLVGVLLCAAAVVTYVDVDDLMDMAARGESLTKFNSLC